MNVTFPQFKLGCCLLQYVQVFKYLGHMITNTQCDDDDVHREIRNLFTRTNILARGFVKCSVDVKVSVHYLKHIVSARMMLVYGRKIR